MGENSDSVPAADVRLAAHLRTLKKIHLGVAHDLRAPLNAALLNLELLRRSLGPDAPPEIAERRVQWLEVVHKELGRLRQALEALLVEVAPGSGVQDRFDLRELLAHLGRLLAAQARQQRIGLAVHTPEAVVPVVADREAVRQVLLSMAVAAFEHAGSGGTVELSLRTGGRSARVRVTAGGAGPVQLDTIVRSIAEEQGGHVRTLDEPGGSGYEVTLPLAGAANGGLAGE